MKAVRIATRPASHTVIGRVVTGAFSWTAALIGAACVGTMRAAFEYALDFARSEKRLGTVPVIEHQNVGFMLADIKMRIEACRYLTWKACHDFERSGGRAEELAIMTKVYCSEAAVATVYDCMRVVGIASYTKDLAPLERIMRDAMVFPLYDGGTRAFAAGSCTISSATPATTRCWPRGERACPRTSNYPKTSNSLRATGRAQ